MRQVDSRSNYLVSQHRDRRIALGTAALLAVVPLAACQTAPSAPSESSFPAVGRKLLVTFPAFRAELHFHSISSLTWVLLNPDGSRGRTERVDIRVQAVGDRLYLVAWQEANKTTVVQVEDFARKVIFTSITRADGTFLQSRGTFVELPDS